MFYAVSWRCGIAKYDGTGAPLRDVYGFPTRSARAEWVKLGQGYPTQPDYRKEVNRARLTSKELRAARELPPEHTAGTKENTMKRHTEDLIAALGRVGTYEELALLMAANEDIQTTVIEVALSLADGRRAAALKVLYRVPLDAIKGDWNKEYAARALALAAIDPDPAIRLLPGNPVRQDPGDYEAFVSLLGAGEVRRLAPPKLSEEARAARAPRPPEELVGALQDRVHRESGALRAAKSVRVRSDR